MINNLKTYFRGGIFLLSAGLIPFSNAFRECMMKCLVGDFADTSEIKSPDKRNKKGKHERKLCQSASKTAVKKDNQNHCQ